MAKIPEVVPASPDALATTSCSCQWADRAWHDELLTLEDQGASGLFELFAYWADEPAHASEDRYTVSSFEFSEFVSYHSWRDPATLAFGRDLDEIFDRYRKDGERYPTRTVAQVDIYEELVNKHEEALAGIYARLRVCASDGLQLEEVEHALRAIGTLIEVADEASPLLRCCGKAIVRVGLGSSVAS